MNDHALLREYADAGSQTAFGQLVERHVALVYSAARRRLGDAHLAEDATQQVFLRLARKARDLPPSVIVSGWLYRTGGLVASEIARHEQRRRERETRAAQAMNDTATDATWREIEPLLEEAMDHLGNTDRDAVILRYFENKSLREVGTALGVTDDAAQKRLSRALEKLRAFLARRGKTVAGGALAGAITTGAIQAAPAGLAQSVATFVFSSAAVAATTSTLGSLMTLVSAKTIVTGAVALGAATALVFQHVEINRLRTDQESALNQTRAAEQAAATAQQALAAATTAAQNDPRLAELARLRGEVAGLRRHEAELTANNAQLAKAVQRSTDARQQAEQLTAEQEEARAKAIARMNYTKQWALAFIMFAEDHGGRMPKTFQEASAYFPQNGQTGDLKPEQFEIMYQGSRDAIKNPSQTILVREIQPVASPGGTGLTRAYVFADGHSEIHQAVDGNFAAWESERLVGSPGQP